jgi:sialic acid synthase SpsE
LVTIRDRRIGDGHPVFITFEAGPTHDGVATAKRLVDHAADAGADAIKFQIMDPDRMVADRSVMFDYEVLVDRETGRTETVTEPLYDLLARRALSFDGWRTVKERADQRGLAFFATVGFDDEVDLLERLGCDSIKIASGDVNHLPLIRRAARTGMCLQLDTGNATLGEIETAVDAIRAEGNESIVIHQCPSGYPARLDSINLNVIPTLKRLFGCPAAFSDHTPGADMDIAAVALGANLVEKTITEDQTIRSVEHVMSLEPADMRRFIAAIRDVEIALGASRRIMHAAEYAKRAKVRRSTFLAEAARAGTRLGDATVVFRRPGDGIGPDAYETLVDRPLARDLPAGHRLDWPDLR